MVAHDEGGNFYYIKIERIFVMKHANALNRGRGRVYSDHHGLNKKISCRGFRSIVS